MIRLNDSQAALVLRALLASPDPVAPDAIAEIRGEMCLKTQLGRLAGGRRRDECLAHTATLQRSLHHLLQAHELMEDEFGTVPDDLKQGTWVGISLLRDLVALWQEVVSEAHPAKAKRGGPRLLEVE